MLKFRAWDKRNEQYLQVTYIDFQNQLVTGIPFLTSAIKPPEEPVTIPYLDTLEQALGKQDITGQELYVGDIVRVCTRWSIINKYRAWVLSNHTASLGIEVADAPLLIGNRNQGITEPQYEHMSYVS
jgi:uncharacterized phage protein (TIGR01671 family)